MPWSQEEVEATVSDYFQMLQFELTGQPYNKAAHNRSLRKMLENRSTAAIELKHQNISAILIDLGCVYIAGYKPRSNYQQLLFDVVAQQIDGDKSFDRIAIQAIQRDAVVPDLERLAGVLVDAPMIAIVHEPKPARPYRRLPFRRDYLERESRNQSLGLAGERFVANFEARRLHAAGQTKLSDRVDHVSVSQGDGLGYDVLSFEPDGRERFY